MGVPEIQNEPCRCSHGQCVEMFGDDDMGHCINRLTGDVRLLLCEICMSHTWHHDGACCRCRALNK